MLENKHMLGINSIEQRTMNWPRDLKVSLYSMIFHNVELNLFSDRELDCLLEEEEWYPSQIQQPDTTTLSDTNDSGYGTLFSLGDYESEFIEGFDDNQDEYGVKYCLDDFQGELIGDHVEMISDENSLGEQ